MKDLLGIYQSTIEKIFAGFGLDGAYGELDIRDTIEWTATDESVHWIQEDGEYANDILREPRTDGDYTIFYVDNSCGDQFYQIFKNSLYKEDLEVYE
jgi:hypothetical protein